VRAREARERAMMALINLIVFANMSQGVEEVGKAALLRGGGKGLSFILETSPVQSHSKEYQTMHIMHAGAKLSNFSTRFSSVARLVWW
jgi:hypothetical protein